MYFYLFYSKICKLLRKINVKRYTQINEKLKNQAIKANVKARK